MKKWYICIYIKPAKSLINIKRKIIPYNNNEHEKEENAIKQWKISKEWEYGKTRLNMKN